MQICTLNIMMYLKMYKEITKEKVNEQFYCVLLSSDLLRGNEGTHS